MKLTSSLLAPLLFTLLLSSQSVSFRASNVRQASSFERALEPKKQAVTELAQALKKALTLDTWCQSGSTCNAKCSYHSCDAPGSEDELTCQNALVPKPCDCEESATRALLLTSMNLTHVIRQNSCDKEELCKDYDPAGNRSLNYVRPDYLTPPKAISSAGNGEQIKVTRTELRRDVCALKAIEAEIARVFKERDMRAVLYAGTTNGLLIKFPGMAFCRDHSSDDPLLACNPFNPTERPWYITASTGPRDIIFMFDDKISNGSPLYKSMLKTLDQLDSRDAVAVRLFDEDKVTPIKYNETRYTTGATVKDLKDTFSQQNVGRTGRSNIRRALEDGFKALQAAKDGQSVATSKCERYIVLMIGSEDTCFESCQPGDSECTCISELKQIVAEHQIFFDRPVSLVLFTETKSGLTFEQRSNMESLARSLACPSGIWSRVVADDSEQTGMLAFRRFGAFLLYDDDSSEDKIFASEIYTDATGLGNVFALAVPVYDQSTQSLVAVAGADITLEELQSDMTEQEVRDEVETFSSADRKCSANVRDVKSERCKANNLRSSLPNSATCPEPVINSTCVKFPNSNSIFYKSTEKKTFTDAEAACRNEHNYAELAVIDTDAKNKFFTSIADVDGTWIGLKGRAGDGILKWPSNSSSDLKGKEVVYDQFPFNKTEWLKELDAKSFEDVCVSADRRGVSGNWNIILCNRKLSFVCELKTTNGTACANQTDTSYSEKCNDGGNGARTCDNTDGIDVAAPFCNQTAKTKSEAERYCCGQSVSAAENGTNSTSTSTSGAAPIGIIAGSLSGAVVLICCICAIALRRKSNDKDETRIASAGESQDSFSPPDFESADTQSVLTLNRNKAHGSRADV